jgi:hypothetical protein
MIDEFSAKEPDPARKGDLGVDFVRESEQRF